MFQNARRTSTRFKRAKRRTSITSKSLKDERIENFGQVFVQRLEPAKLKILDIRPLKSDLAAMLRPRRKLPNKETFWLKIGYRLDTFSAIAFVEPFP